MNKRDRSTLSTIFAGLLVLAPIYLAVLLLLKAIRSLSTILGPRQVAPTMVTRCTHSFFASRLDNLLPHWFWNPLSDRARDLGANREVTIPENPRLSTLAKSYSATGG